MFSLVIEERVQIEIEEAFEYYEKRNVTVAINFFTEVQSSYLALQINPHFQVRYKTYRCLPMKGFPFMLHFTIDETARIVKVHALINTSQNPNQYWIKEPELEYKTKLQVAGINSRAGTFMSTDEEIYSPHNIDSIVGDYITKLQKREAYLGAEVTYIDDSFKFAHGAYFI